MGVFYANDTTSMHFAKRIEPQGKLQDEASAETRDSTKSATSERGEIFEESPMMEDFDDAIAMMPPMLNRLTTDEHCYPSHVMDHIVVQDCSQGVVDCSQGVVVENMAPVEHAPAQLVPGPLLNQVDNAMSMQSAVEMAGNMSMQGGQGAEMHNGIMLQRSPTDMSSQSPDSPMGMQSLQQMNMPMMYTDMGMQSAAPQRQMQWQGSMQQQGQAQYVQMVPQMMVQMVPYPVPVPQTQMPMNYYMVPPMNAEQPRAEPEMPKNFLESLMPKGWRKRQRPSKRPTSRVQKVPNGRKIFVGGMSPNTTAESLIKHFGEFGKISDASVIHEAVTRKSRGFGYVEFADKIPDGLLDIEHFIDQRRCGVRGYNYDPEDDKAAPAA
jgi:hypothetical protein